MKKLFFKIVAVISLVAVVFGATGCALFEVNADRDMRQVAATVNTIDANDEDATVNIYKRDIVAGYYSYGYYYVQNYGYTTAKAYQLIVDNLVNNEVIVQQGKKKLASDAPLAISDVAVLGINDDVLSLLASDKDIEAYEKSSGKKVGDEGYAAGLTAYVSSKYTGVLSAKDASFRFVSTDDIWQAVSDAVESVNSFIDSFADDEDEHEHNHESASYTVRTTPEMEEEDETVDVDACKEIIDDSVNGLAAKVSGDRLKALVKGYNRLVSLGLADSSEKYYEGADKNNATLMSVMQLGYFKDYVKSALDSKLVEKFEKRLRDEKSAASAKLWEQYVELGEKQKSEYVGDVSSLETALGEVSSEKFVVYNSGFGYGYVSHLVVEYTEDQKQKITDAKAEADATEETIKNLIDSDEMIDGMIIKDLRDSWVKSGYGVYDAADGSYKFSDKYVYNVDGELAKYKGFLSDVTAFVEENDDGEEELHFNFGSVNANELGYTDFTTLVKNYLNLDSLEMNVPVQAKNSDGRNYSVLNAEERRCVLNSFEDIKFAFSTDTGNFNKYLGYLYSPLTASGTYVTEFVDACEKAVKAGAGSVVMFMSESYGLHILICTEVEADYGKYATEAAFTADLDVKGSVAYNFKQANLDLIESAYVSKQADAIIAKYTKYGDKGDNEYVKHFNKVYKDLVSEE